ncbi:MAG: flippase-like domain-containing protein, partial [Anaerolineales bacterium]|nr:flippase-like domain-containing protein [Anaerolineales bacterium]
LLGHRLAAFGVSYFTPGTQFGGEPVQVLLVEREHQVPRTTAVAAVTLDKTLELLVNFAFLTAGITAVLQSRLFGSRLGAELMWPSLGLLALPGLLWIAIWRGWMPISRVVGWLASWSVWGKRPFRQHTLNRLVAGIRTSEAEATRLFQNAPLTLWAAFVISIVGWLLMIAEYWLMLTYLGIDLTPLQAVALLTAARIAILMPLPGGLGTLEASQVFALSAMGQNSGAGLSISVLIRARDVLLGLFGLWWGGRRLNLLRRRTQMNPSPTDGVFISTIAAHDEAGL